MIGDKDPEDAYDAGDPPRERLAVLERILDDLRAREPDDRRELRRLDALRLIVNLGRELDELRARADELGRAFEAI